MTDLYGISQTRRLTVPAAEAKLYEEQPFSNNFFVRLIDYSGGDDAVVRGVTAGVGRELLGNPSNEELFGYMRTNGLTEAFRFPEIKMHFKAPIHVALFWVYLRSARVNELSGRYSVMSDSGRVFSRKEIYNFLPEDVSNKEAFVNDIYSLFDKAQKLTRKNYDVMLQEGFVRELARMGLGLGTETQFYLTLNLEDAIIASSQAVANSFNKDLVDSGLVVYDLIRSVAPDQLDSFLDLTRNHRTIEINRTLLENNPDDSLRYGTSQTRRLTVSAMEDLLFKKQVLLDSGWIMPVDYMGTDESVVQAARASYGSGNKKASEDVSLLRFLLRHKHTSPFEQVSISFDMKTPIFISPRQAFRHRTAVKEGVLGNTIPLKDFYIPEHNEIRSQSNSNKQVRGELLSSESIDIINNSLSETFKIQDELRTSLRDSPSLDFAVDSFMGVGHYTRTCWKQDIHNILHFMRLRDHSHAQFEIQQLARLISDNVKACFPLTYQAYNDYIKCALTFSSQEQTLLAKLLSEQRELGLEDYRELGWVTPSDKLGREALEFKQKLNLILGDNNEA